MRMKEIEEARYIAWFPFGVSINPDGGEFSVIEVESLLQAAPRDLYISLALYPRPPLHSHSTRAVSAQCEIIIKTENFCGAYTVSAEKDIPYICREGRVHSRGIRITSHTTKPCCSCNARVPHVL